jgi:hypothetical protein
VDQLLAKNLTAFGKQVNEHHRWIQVLVESIQVKIWTVLSRGQVITVRTVKA